MNRRIRYLYVNICGLLFIEYTNFHQEKAPTIHCNKKRHHHTSASSKLGINLSQRNPLCSVWDISDPNCKYPHYFICLHYLWDVILVSSLSTYFLTFLQNMLTFTSSIFYFLIGICFFCSLTDHLLIWDSISQLQN